MLDIHTNLFIIKQQDFKDLDRIITVFTEHYGKRTIKLTSSYKFLSKLNSNLQMFSVVDCDIVIGKNFDKVCNASVVNVFENMLTDIRKNIAYVFVSEIINKEMDLNFADKGVYDLSIDIFNKINEVKLSESTLSTIDFKKDTELIKILYEFVVKFLKLNGYSVRKIKEKIENKDDFFEFVCHNIEKQLEVEIFFS